MFTIELNGKKQEVTAGSTVSDILALVGSNGKNAAVLVNEKIVRPENRSTAIVQEGDRIEVLVFAGGG
ncbi:MAG: sulfur carrier protein ThiS [Chlorobium sp.]|nr:MAG: sulfur carrier protein ThiS [Chlorobium sp.]